MKPTHAKAKTLLILFVLTLALNFLSALGWLTGHTQKELSDTYQTLLTPAPAAFSIWSIIYLLLLLMLLRFFTRRESWNLEQLFPWITAALIFNNLWNLLFTSNQVFLSCLAIIGYLLVLSKINRIVLDEPKVGLYKIGFGLHSGWLLVATLVNIAALFVKHGWILSFGRSLFATLLLFSLSYLASWLSKKWSNPTFPLPIAWAWLQVFQAHQDGRFNHSYPLIQYSAIVCCLILVIASLLDFFNKTEY